MVNKEHGSPLSEYSKELLGELLPELVRDGTIVLIDDVFHWADPLPTDAWEHQTLEEG